MSYIERVLNENEQILYRARIHPIFLLGYLSMMVIFIVIGVLYTLFAFAGIPLLLLAAHPYWTTQIAVTNRRMIYKQGLLARDIQEILLNKIEGINIEQTILGRIFNYGAVRVRGVGIGEIDLPKDLDAPLEFKKAIDSVRI